MDLRSRTVSAIGVGICAAGLLLAGVPARAADLTVEEQAHYADLEARPLHSFSNVDLADYLRLRNKSFEGIADRPTPAEEVGHFARKALGQPFRLNANRFDLAESDCVVFVERSIAMACATDWDSYYKICERLRHKDGVVAYKNRNFFTLGDWLPNNLAWGVFEDVTGQVGSSVAKAFTHVVRPKVFVPRANPGPLDSPVVFKGADYASPDKQMRAELYIPGERVAEVVAGLKTGDVCLIIRRYEKEGLAPWFDCNHMGLIVVDADGVQLVHSAPGRVRSQPLVDFPGIYKQVAGFKFLRLKADVSEAVTRELTRLVPSENSPSPQDVDMAVERRRQER